MQRRTRSGQKGKCPASKAMQYIQEHHLGYPQAHIGRRSGMMRIREFESGERYTKLKKQHDAEIRKKDALISRLKKELASANARIITNRNHFMEAMEDVLKEKDALQLKMERKLKKEQECRYKAEARIDEVMDRLSQKQKKLDEAYERIEELEGRITKLTAQVNCNYENSSRPSSQCPNHKKIENSREKSDRPGEPSPDTRDIQQNSRSRQKRTSGSLTRRNLHKTLTSTSQRATMFITRSSACGWNSWYSSTAPICSSTGRQDSMYMPPSPNGPSMM